MIEKEDDKNYASLAAHLETLESTKAILYALKERGIEAIILKGIYLALTFYKDLSRQPGSDVDLLVKRPDVLEVKSILNRLGWQERADILPDLVADYGLSGLNSLMFFNPDSLVSVHLHWHIINTTWPLGPYIKRINMDEVWRLAADGLLDGAPIKTLKPEYLLIYLCFHGFNHHFSKPVYVNDIRIVLEHFKADIDWVFLNTRAREWEMGWLVDYCMEYIKNPRIAKYDDIYWRYFTREKGLRQKILFLYRTLFPRKSQMAMINNLPIKKIKSKHYLGRFKTALHEG